MCEGVCLGVWAVGWNSFMMEVCVCLCECEWVL